MTRTSRPLHLKFAASDAEAGTFSGFASTYNDAPDSYGDVIAPGAFAKSIARHDAAGTRPALLWQHDQTNPVGVWLDFEDTTEGLIAHGKLTLDVPQAAAAHALMKDGALALSIGYSIAPDGAEVRQGITLLREVELHEVSLVAMPANANTHIHSVKAFDSAKPDPRTFEQAARDALGLSAREAKRLMAGGWSGLVRDAQPDDSEELAAVAAHIKRITATLRTGR